MQTSRIRHALSSVQLFIERCLMNLEPRVAPSSIKAKQWEWMRRYRVWEANRKVFLWPENWLEPELRDDQSPFFKETMSELLQSDITEDRAATALLNYLSKLEEVAKLEPCGIHYVENEPGRRRRHRPRGGPHRRGQPQVLLPPPRVRLLDAVGADQARHRGQPGDPGRLERTPVPVLAEDSASRRRTDSAERMHQTSGQEKSAATHQRAQGTRRYCRGRPKVTVQAMLCWSEYYNGKWQPTKTSDINQPADIQCWQTDATLSTARDLWLHFEEGRSEDADSTPCDSSGQLDVVVPPLQHPQPAGARG